ncbi:hypothetical protein IMG5_065500 [Ichthyophthirius multifiliis]|uniref:Uncharacterized protein n=1 Tax=Ichthyophthirius multifiliis TaxID=5932 RepID=G0QP93_ICHMU|nr:hypothetical protein IMG5_065500 [Ichthyophthirius multifiliis]EGR32963.1 hypothetical protein IMG5_065500 [Ichthyophthirius multifiliis]|eukprot:XP_004036949.1 hypothetical protein IMG5_065500 [Ichthyophthirius multifiliis]
MIVFSEIKEQKECTQKCKTEFPSLTNCLCDGEEFDIPESESDSCPKFCDDVKNNPPDYECQCVQNDQMIVFSEIKEQKECTQKCKTEFPSLTNCLCDGEEFDIPESESDSCPKFCDDVKKNPPDYECQCVQNDQMIVFSEIKEQKECKQKCKTEFPSLTNCLCDGEEFDIPESESDSCPKFCDDVKNNPPDYECQCVQNDQMIVFSEIKEQKECTQKCTTEFPSLTNCLCDGEEFDIPESESDSCPKFCDDVKNNPPDYECQVSFAYYCLCDGEEFDIPESESDSCPKFCDDVKKNPPDYECQCVQNDQMIVFSEIKEQKECTQKCKTEFPSLTNCLCDGEEFDIPESESDSCPKFCDDVKNNPPDYECQCIQDESLITLKDIKTSQECSIQCELQLTPTVACLCETCTDKCLQLYPIKSFCQCSGSFFERPQNFTCTQVCLENEITSQISQQCLCEESYIKISLEQSCSEQCPSPQTYCKCENGICVKCKDENAQIVLQKFCSCKENYYLDSVKKICVMENIGSQIDQCELEIFKYITQVIVIADCDLFVDQKGINYIQITDGCEPGQECVIIADLDTSGRICQDQTCQQEIKGTVFKVGESIFIHIWLKDNSYSKQLQLQKVVFKGDDIVMDYTQLCSLNTNASNANQLGNLFIQCELMEPAQEATLQVSLLVQPTGRVRRLNTENQKQKKNFYFAVFGKKKSTNAVSDKQQETQQLSKYSLLIEYYLIIFCILQAIIY